MVKKDSYYIADKPRNNSYADGDYWGVPREVQRMTHPGSQDVQEEQDSSVQAHFHLILVKSVSSAPITVEVEPNGQPLYSHGTRHSGRCNSDLP